MAPAAVAAAGSKSFKTISWNRLLECALTLDIQLQGLPSGGEQRERESILVHIPALCLTCVLPSHRRAMDFLLLRLSCISLLLRVGTCSCWNTLYLICILCNWKQSLSKTEQWNPQETLFPLEVSLALKLLILLNYVAICEFPFLLNSKGGMKLHFAVRLSNNHLSHCISLKGFWGHILCCVYHCKIM